MRAEIKATVAGRSQLYHFTWGRLFYFRPFQDRAAPRVEIQYNTFQVIYMTRDEEGFPIVC